MRLGAEKKASHVSLHAQKHCMYKFILKNIEKSNSAKESLLSENKLSQEKLEQEELPN